VPTQEDLTTAFGHLEQLAYRHHGRNNPNGAPDIIRALWQLYRVDTEREQAKDDATWPPGTDSTHTIGQHAQGRPVEARFIWGNGPRPYLRDPYYRTLTAHQRTMLHQLGQLVDGWADLVPTTARAG
jgi:hypothetical protein